MRIILTITDPETIEAYLDIDPELIIDDLLNDPKALISVCDIEIEKEHR